MIKYGYMILLSKSGHEEIDGYNYFWRCFIKAVRLVVEGGRLISEVVRELYQKMVRMGIWGSP